MIIDVTYAYNLPYIPPRRRIGESLVVRSLFPVEIRELTDDEAPVAFWSVDPGMRNDRVPYRAYDGGFLRPVYLSTEDYIEPGVPVSRFAEDTGTRQYRDEPPAGVLTTKGLIAMAADGLPSGLPSRYPMSRRSEPAASIDVAIARRMPGRLDEGTNTQRIQSQIAKGFENFLLIDGIVHVPCPMPFIDASPYLWGTCWPDDHSFNDAASLYPVTRFAEASELFLGYQRASRVEPARIAALEPRILRPELVPVGDVLGEVSRSLAGRILRMGASMPDNYRKGGPAISREPKETMMAYAGLKRAVDAGDQRDLVDALERFAATPFGPSIIDGEEMRRGMRRIEAETALRIEKGTVPCI
jgi:hypothetical protein